MTDEHQQYFRATRPQWVAPDPSDVFDLTVEASTKAAPLRAAAPRARKTPKTEERDGASQSGTPAGESIATEEDATEPAVSTLDYEALLELHSVKGPRSEAFWRMACSDNQKYQLSKISRTRRGPVAYLQCSGRMCSVRRRFQLSADGWVLDTSDVPQEHCHPAPDPQSVERGITQRARAASSDTKATIVSAVQVSGASTQPRAIHRQLVATHGQAAPSLSAVRHIARTAFAAIGLSSEADLMNILDDYGQHVPHVMLRHGFDMAVELLVTNQQMLDVLAAHGSMKVYIDGTHGLCLYGAQVVTVAVVVRGYSIPVCYWITQTHTRATYERMLEVLRKYTCHAYAELTR